MLIKRKREHRESIIEPGYCGGVTKQDKFEHLSHKIINKVKPVLRPAYRSFRHFIIFIICMLRPDYKGIIYVNPLEIERTVNLYDSTLKRNNMWHFGSVDDGDWDLGGAPIKEYGYIYPILKQRTEHRLDYSAIPEFMENLALISKGEKPDNCGSEKQYKEKWGRIEKIFNHLKREGYKSQKELKSGYPFNEIRVQVGRQGDLFFEEGIHRLVISQLLRFEKIPVLVTRRHNLWVKEKGKKIYKRG